MAATKPLPNIEYLKECFEYRDGKIFWLHRPRHHFNYYRSYRQVNSKQAGNEAGCINHEKGGDRWIICIGKKIYKRSHIVFALFHNRFVEKVDHKDGITTNDRIDNLREATCSQNAMNAKRSSRNKTGYKGVYYFESKNRYVANIMVNGKGIYLGRFMDAMSAHQAYCKASEKYHGEFARTE